MFITFPVLRPRISSVRGRRRFDWARAFRWLVLLSLLWLGEIDLLAQTNAPFAGQASLLPFKLNFGLESASPPQEVDSAIKIVFALTLLTLAPSIILLMTCFTRVVIVLSFVRTALSLPGTPANQIIVGLSLFITLFVMAPVWDNIQRDALQPYNEKQISGGEALEQASRHLRTFMLRQARPKDVELFVSMAKMGPTTPEQLPLKVVIPGFIISELRTAFQMGFLLFVPFILIDLVVATVLMSLGMMMMPPMTISLPLKILLFVLVDGWGLIVRSLVQSFN
ncbi:MAG: flagellar type III secretion system pore protein FliP [Verrucomicrobia bacterium]|nr:flagellar type III secretion system pore protein FliP [Verrucomicrobiota bacterium]